MNHFPVFLALLVSALCLTGAPLIKAQPLLITEIMARNASALQDADGDTPDWIEIFNASDAEADLEGWQLMNDKQNPKGWAFPAVTMAPGAYKLIFASGKDRRQPGGELHSDFRLRGAGEYLAIASPDGEIVHSFDPTYPPLGEDESFGLKISEDGRVLGSGLLDPPTPGEPNLAVAISVAEAPRFSRASGTFSSPFALEIRNPLNRGTIRYTLDQSAPTESSPVYESPIPIDSTAQVRARIFEADFAPGHVTTATFSRLADDLRGFSSNIAVVVVDTLGAIDIGEMGFNTSYFSLFEPNDERTRLTDGPTLATRSGIRVRGSSSTERPKKSYAIEFWEDGEDEDRDLSPLGMPAEADWILYGPFDFDQSLIRNAFIYELSNQIGRYAVRTRFVELYLNDDGGALSESDYNGAYVLMEKIERGADRVDIERMSLLADSEPELAGGWIIKKDRPDPGDRGFTAGLQDLQYVEPKEGELSRPQQFWMRGYIREFFQALVGDDFTDPELGYARYVDVGSWIDHHILNQFGKNPDAFIASDYMFKSRYGKLEAGPVWDFDRGLGSDDLLFGARSPEGWAQGFSYGWYGAMFKDPDYWQAYIDRFQALRAGAFSIENLLAIVDRMAPQLEEAQARNFVRWPGYVNPAENEWQIKIQEFRDWLTARVEWTDTQFPAPPVSDRFSGALEGEITLTLSVEEGLSAYYRSDGLDPRLSGGEVRPGSVEVTESPVELTVSAGHHIIARTTNGRRWSGALERIFIEPDLARLRVTEIMYNPPPDPDGGFDGEQFEFIEFLNAADQPLNLAGIQFSEGIGFDFPARTLLPGETVVIVKNKRAFENRYGVGAATVLGEYAGSLANNGERLTLVDAAGRELFDIRYDDRTPWPEEADGSGRSMVLAGPQAPPNLPESWIHSEIDLGTPGFQGEPEARPAIAFTQIERTDNHVRILFRTDLGDETNLKVLTTDDVRSAGWSESGLTPKRLDGDLWEIEDEISSQTRWYRIQLF